MEKNHTNVFINQTLPGTSSGTFVHTIDVPFKPKTVTVSNITYVNDAGTEEGLLEVKTNLINSLDNVLFVIHEDSFTVCSVPLVYNCRNSVRGQIEFQYNGTVARSGHIAFALTFRD